MKPSRTSAILSTLNGAFIVAVPMTFAQPALPQAPAGKFQLRPANPEPPEVLAERQQTAQALQGINQGRLSPQQKRQMLLNHGNPNIRVKAHLAMKRAPSQPLPATSEPPDIKAQAQEADNALQGLNQGRLSSQQKRQLLLNHPNQRIREKAQEAQRFKIQPRSGLDGQSLFASSSSLLAWLNPFTASEVLAQSGYSLTLTPQSPYSSNPRGFLSFYGVTITRENSVFGSTFKLNNLISSPPRGRFNTFCVCIHFGPSCRLVSDRFLW